MLGTVDAIIRDTPTNISLKLVINSRFYIQFVKNVIFLHVTVVNCSQMIEMNVLMKIDLCYVLVILIQIIVIEYMEMLRATLAAVKMIIVQV